MILATTTEDFRPFTDNHKERVRLCAEAGFKHIDLSLYTLIKDDPLFGDGWRAAADELLSYAESLGVPQVITRLGRLDNSAFIDQLSIGSVVSPGKLCCNTIVRYVRAMKNRDGAAAAIHHIADGQAEAIEFLVDPDTLHCNDPLKKINIKKNVRIACIARGNEIIIPGGDDYFQGGDSVVVVVNGESTVLELNDIFE